MIRVLLLILLLVSVDGAGDHTVWEDEDAAREAALAAAEAAEEDGDPTTSDED